MKKIILSVLLLTIFGCSTSNESKRDKEQLIKVEDIDPLGGADAYNFSGDNQNSRYYVNPDFYRIKSDEQLTLIENFKTVQQTTEWSCGPATAFMVVQSLGISDYSEQDLATLMKAHTDLDVENAEIGTANNFGEYGTSVGQMITAFNSIDNIKVVETSYHGSKLDPSISLTDNINYPKNKQNNYVPTFSAMSLYTSQNDDGSEDYVAAKDSYFVKWLTDNLTNNRPIMVEWADWDGHWQAIIGYDNNGTPEIGDDILIFADPYDTSDHMQDGYYYYPLERWFYMWSDLSIGETPYQLQQYIIIDTK